MTTPTARERAEALSEAVANELIRMNRIRPYDLIPVFQAALEAAQAEAFEEAAVIAESCKWYHFGELSPETIAEDLRARAAALRAKP